MFFPIAQAFSNGLCQQIEGNNKYRQFYTRDVIRRTKQAEQTHCIVCGKTGASITCAQTGCGRSFHLPCASKGECVTQYFNEYRSFCWEHRPQQSVDAVPVQDTICIICMDPVEDNISYGTMVCPSCRCTWFHRACIQGETCANAASDASTDHSMLDARDTAVMVENVPVLSCSCHDTMEGVEEEGQDECQGDAAEAASVPPSRSGSPLGEVKSRPSAFPVADDPRPEGHFPT
ncbi:hypothetical protein ASZ78_007938 [Callipepla squamata]|uniref:PHD-type domain-containing protein n=1 Tax=Callipepla squamata TaxID=9009 RepID=A0A226MC49_CALSU|nr:hypothetical protein ASZ78_007938 [Callipepla squamata]